MSHDKGDRVVATKDIGGTLRDFVPKGSKGVITASGWTAPTKVLFTIEGGFFSGKKQVEITVSDDEIA